MGSVQQAIQDAGHREHPPDDGAGGGDEVVEGLRGLGHHDLDGRHVVRELGGGDEQLPVRVVHVAVHRVLVRIDVAIRQPLFGLHSRQHNLRQGFNEKARGTVLER